jgi:transposase
LVGEAAQLRAELERLVAGVAPWLLELLGVGPISAAQILVSWSHAGRLRSEAAFAALAGANPIPASSGQVTRHRLNRSGDRQLNRALHTIVVARLRDDPDTRAYAARRRAEGKSMRDIRRCLKGGGRPAAVQTAGTLRERGRRGGSGALTEHGSTALVIRPAEIRRSAVTHLGSVWRSSPLAAASAAAHHA